MVLKTLARKGLLTLLTLIAAAGAAGAEPPQASQSVSLPLAEYLALLARAEQRDEAAAASLRGRAAPVAEVVEERIAIRLEEKEAVLDSFFEVVVQGEPAKPVWLPLAGYGSAAAIEILDARGAWTKAAGASLTAMGGAGQGTVLVAAEKGRYRIRAASRLPFDPGAGQIEVRLLPVAAPVASAEIDLPAELEWSSAGAVLVAEKTAGGRRQVSLATQRGQATAIQARRRFAQGDEKPLAHAVLLTLLQLRPEGLRRHDVLLYEVSRGRLSAFDVALPAGLEIEQAATDEGPVVPIQAGGRLRVERRRQLQGIGYLVLSSTPAAAEVLPLTAIAPEVEVRARFLAVASSIAAEIGPQPAASFAQIDLTDLPPLLGEALGAVDLAAAWRLQDEKAGASLVLRPLPAAEKVAATVNRRDTTTLLTVDGTLLHRETFLLAASDRPSSSFEVMLPEGATLWSTKVDGQPTRPLMRGGKVVLPILPRRGESTVVEVVAVLEQAIPAGRSQLAVGLMQVAAPVLEHNWRLLLPDGPKYRYAGGDLQPVPMRFAEPREGRRGRGRGSIAGRVTADQVSLPGVTLTLEGPAGRLTAASGADGLFLFRELPPGDYRVTAELEGFSTLVWEAELDGGQGLAVDLPMKTADLVEEIVVSTSALLPLAVPPALKDKKQRRENDELEAAGNDAAASYSAQVGELQQGLVGGVKPLPITIPEAGKALVLTGVLPPERVSVMLDVKAKGK